MASLRSCLLLLALCIPAVSLAVIESYDFETDDLYTRYQVLSEELRCPKCQNQNIAASNAPIAQDLRKQLHQQLHEGKSDSEIVDFMVQRYGEFVLYRPRWSAATALLWLAPVILLGLGLWILLSLIGRGQGAVTASASGEAEEIPASGDSAESQLSDSEQARLQSLLGSENKP